jgi:large subunit ribosomal protein L16
MLLQPKKTKYKKLKKGKIPKLNFKSNTLKFGTTGLQAIESGMITAKQLEAARQAINRNIKRKGKIWIRVFPSIPVTSKPTEVRMGKGKGSVDYWGIKVSAGTILFELCGINVFNSISAFRTGSAKLPIKTKVLIK